MTTSTTSEQAVRPAQTGKKAEWRVRQRRRKFFAKGGITTFTLLLCSLYLAPLAYGFLTSLKTETQISDPTSPILPYEPATLEYEGKEYDILNVTFEDGSTQQLALYQKGRESSQFLDPANPDAEALIEWEGRWRTLEPARDFSPKWSNYPEAFEKINFARLLGNTLMYAVTTTIMAVTSAAIVAYGFARYNFPFKNVLFIILIATIILPPQVTLVPTYAFFTRIGWTGTWLPLIVPTIFSNAYNVFLMRQYYLTIPREMEEAAMIDGAGPVRTFVSVILPQAVPALTAVTLFHFFFAWNDFFGPLIYLVGKPDLVPLSVGLTTFNGLFDSSPQLIQAASIMTIILPLTIFFFAQRIFIQGVVITGVDK